MRLNFFLKLPHMSRSQETREKISKNIPPTKSLTVLKAEKRYFKLRRRKIFWDFISSLSRSTHQSASIELTFVWFGSVKASEFESHLKNIFLYRILFFKFQFPLEKVKFTGLFWWPYCTFSVPFFTQLVFPNACGQAALIWCSNRTKFFTFLSSSRPLFICTEFQIYNFTDGSKDKHALRALKAIICERIRLKN